MPASGCCALRRLRLFTGELSVVKCSSPFNFSDKCLRQKAFVRCSTKTSEPPPTQARQSAKTPRLRHLKGVTKNEDASVWVEEVRRRRSSERRRALIPAASSAEAYPEVALFSSEKSTSPWPWNASRRDSLSKPSTKCSFSFSFSRCDESAEPNCCTCVARIDKPCPLRCLKKLSSETSSPSQACQTEQSIAKPPR